MKTESECENRSLEAALKMKKIEALNTTLSAYIKIQSDWIKCWDTINPNLQKKIDELIIDIKEFK